ncbi:DUF2490 domain-containing protein [Formosa maritima]|uniref:DUF2490 domain-containing protein n=1 Tax=Formosa maritima TaxID=2592046 RepID=A0A5D0GJX3_9FLAO|nr:DUF2490 domain-containing protein [Formosa maritima]TYA59131.1 DUF2490 domain-containing protein [Formosa maritima]
MKESYRKLLFINLVILICNFEIKAQDQNQTGAWYMYFYNHQFSESQFGIQGDVQYRNWNIIGDLEQLLLRSGVTYKPKKADILFTLGYAYILSGALGDSDATTFENRIYQEALLPLKVGGRVYLINRFRYEQRFVDEQDFRTRYRYNLFINIPVNNKEFTKGTFYTALYNEIFINGQKDIGDGRNVEFFDRNRTYLGAGYVLNSKIKFQFGWMNQVTNSQGKGQLQFSMHHKF